MLWNELYPKWADTDDDGKISFQEASDYDFYMEQRRERLREEDDPLYDDLSRSVFDDDDFDDDDFADDYPDWSFSGYSPAFAAPKIPERPLENLCAVPNAVPKPPAHIPSLAEDLLLLIALSAAIFFLTVGFFFPCLWLTKEESSVEVFELLLTFLLLFCTLLPAMIVILFPFIVHIKNSDTDRTYFDDRRQSFLLFCPEKPKPFFTKATLISFVIFWFFAFRPETVGYLFALSKGTSSLCCAMAFVMPLVLLLGKKVLRLVEERRQKKSFVAQNFPKDSGKQ